MYRKIILSLLLLMLPACSIKSSQQISTDLWKTWEQMDELVQRDYPEQPPVILVHGWNGGEFTWPAPDTLKALEDKLERDIYLFTYRTGIIANRYPPLEVLEEKLDRFLVKYPKVDVIAHSMGGVLLRQYLSHHPDNPVHRIVFLSTPHFGTNAARFLTGLASLSAEGNIQASEIRPGSDFLWQLNELKGAELEGMDVLNVYVGEVSLLETDFVVDEASAYLPWGATNVHVKGDHHTLASRLASFDFIVDFIRDGSMPAPAVTPKRRDIWLRFVKQPGEGPESFTQASVQRLNAKHVLTKEGVSTCCEGRTGLYPTGGNVAVIEDLHPDETIVYRSRQAGWSAELKSNDLMASELPVQLKTVYMSGESPVASDSLPKTDNAVPPQVKRTDEGGGAQNSSNEGPVSQSETAVSPATPAGDTKDKLNTAPAEPQSVGTP